MNEHPYVDLLRKVYTASTPEDVGTAISIFSEDVIMHWLGKNPLSGDYQGRDKVFGVFLQMKDMAPDFKTEIIDLLANDDRTVGIVRSTASRPGKKLDVMNVDIWRIKDGKIIEFWFLSDDQYAEDDFWS